MGLEEIIRQNSLDVSIVGFSAVVILVGLGIYYKESVARFKGVLFSLIVLIAIGGTTYLVGATVYLNNSSQTKGPVHWHADLEIWKCGQEVRLEPPSGLSNRIGTPLFHEHGDKKIHVEGVVVDMAEVSLKNFFKTIGGNLENYEMSIPTGSIPDMLDLRTGMLCSPGVEGKFQVFVYTVQDDKVTQKKLENPKDYIISSNIQAPPGDCIIIELDTMRDKTDKMCQSYDLAIKTGKFKYD